MSRPSQKFLNKKTKMSKLTKDENNKLIKTSNSLVSSFQNDINKIDASKTILSEPTKELLKNHLDNEAYRKIHEMFTKTESLKNVAALKNKEIQGQFQELRSRLSKSSQCLQRVKREIDNVKFSYQQKIIDNIQADLNPGNIYPTKNTDLAKQMEDVQNKISKIQAQVNEQKKCHTVVAQNYQEAFENVTQVFQDIDQGVYASKKLKKE